MGHGMTCAPCRSPFLPLASLVLATLSSPSTFGTNPPPPDFGTVREEHIMIPMRDGKRLSAYVLFPKGEGKFPAIFEQRYADSSSAGARKAAAKFAEGGFVIALVKSAR